MILWSKILAQIEFLKSRRCKIMKINTRYVYTNRKLLIFFTICLISSTFFYRAADFSDKTENSRFLHPNSASVHSPIYITGNDELNAFCSGNRTTGSSWETAHVIENFEIDGGGFGQGIAISSTDLYLIIRNITTLNMGINSWEAGISLSNSKNVKIINTITYDNQIGIRIIDSKNIKLEGNYAFGNGVGIEIRNSNKINLLCNTVSENSWSITIDHSDYNTISGNNIWGNDVGVAITNSDFNTISQNSVWDNNYGLTFFLSNNNSIMENNVSDNNIGFTIARSGNYVIGSNIFVNNSDYQLGLYLGTIYFDDGTAGNYWGDYSEKYQNTPEIDGIMQTPYEIDNGKNDRFPLAEIPIIKPYCTPDENPSSTLDLLIVLGFASLAVVLTVIFVKVIKKRRYQEKFEEPLF